MEYLVLAPPVAVVVRVTEDSASRGLIIPLIIQTIRLDRFGSVWTDEAPNLSSPDRSGADQIDAEHQATDLAVMRGCWPVPHIAVPFRSDMAAMVDGSAAGCPAWTLPQCPHAPAEVVDVRRAGACGLPVSGRPRPVSARPDSRSPPAASPGPLDQRRRASATCARCRRAGTAAAGPPQSCPSRPGSRTPRPVSGWLRNRTPRTRWLSAAASGTAVGVRTVGWCPDGWVSAADTSAACGVRGYRNRSSGRRPLDGCRHCR